MDIACPACSSYVTYEKVTEKNVECECGFVVVRAGMIPGDSFIKELQEATPLPKTTEELYKGFDQMRSIGISTGRKQVIIENVKSALLALREVEVDHNNFCMWLDSFKDEIEDEYRRKRKNESAQQDCC